MAGGRQVVVMIESQHCNPASAGGVCPACGRQGVVVLRCVPLCNAPVWRSGVPRLQQAGSGGTQVRNAPVCNAPVWRSGVPRLQQAGSGGT